MEPRDEAQRQGQKVAEPQLRALRPAWEEQCSTDRPVTSDQLLILRWKRGSAHRFPIIVVLLPLNGLHPTNFIAHRGGVSRGVEARGWIEACWDDLLVLASPAGQLSRMKGRDKQN